MQYKDALNIALEEFAKRDPLKMAEKSGGHYLAEESVIEISYLNKKININHPTGEIYCKDSKDKLEHEEEVFVLQYMIEASGLPLRNKWLAFIELPGGPHHNAPFQQIAINPIAEKYGENLKLFAEKAASYGGRKIEMADAGFEFFVFPMLPLAFIIWGADDEFAANANILFDASAPSYLSTAALYVAGINVAKRIFNI